MTKVYKIEILVVDHDDFGEKGIVDTLEDVRYPSINPTVLSVQERDIGKWDDSNPLNFSDKIVAEADRLFGRGLKTATGKVLARFENNVGTINYVVETTEGTLHIVGPEQITKGHLQ